MFYYNTEQYADERFNSVPLTLQEEYDVVAALDHLDFGDNERELIQRFLNEYQNLKYFRTVHFDLPMPANFAERLE